jgi:hypothetical protein
MRSADPITTVKVRWPTVEPPGDVEAQRLAVAERPPFASTTAWPTFGRKSRVTAGE